MMGYIDLVTTIVIYFGILIAGIFTGVVLTTRVIYNADKSKKFFTVRDDNGVVWSLIWKKEGEEGTTQ